MEFGDILRNNIDEKKIHQPCEKSKEGHELDDVKIIYRRCKKCGKFVAVGDPELIKRRGVSGRG